MAKEDYHEQPLGNPHTEEYQTDIETWTRVIHTADDVIAVLGEIDSSTSVSRATARWETEFGDDHIHCTLIRRVGAAGFTYRMLVFSTIDSDPDTVLTWSAEEDRIIDYEGGLENKVERDLKASNMPAGDSNRYQLAELELVQLLATAPIESREI